MTALPVGGHTALLALQEAHAFDPAPLRSGLHGVHVPFDEMTGTPTCEAVLDRAVTAMERVAVSGGSGVGKTSLVQHVLATSADDLAVVRVPVEAEDPATVSEPAAFAAHLVRTVARYLAEARRISGAAQDDLVSGAGLVVSTERSRHRRAGLGLPLWATDVTIATELGSVVTATGQRSGAEVVALAQQVVDTVSDRGLRPVIVIDDSDAWLRTPLGDRSDLVGPFFTRVLRMLAEELTASLVVAVHSDYYALPGFPADVGFIEQSIPVPELPAPTALDRIICARIEVLGDDSPAAEAHVTPEAIEALFAAYRSEGRSVRRAMLLAHTALQIACQDGADAINDRHIDAALTYYDHYDPARADARADVDRAAGAR
ncbi:MAG TPA: hypothetical protein VK640_05180 [Actinomycetes bacterium]|nr:hypothetical protein [Actinomycetes bacterium]